jgi:hypothetical protein
VKDGESFFLSPFPPINSYLQVLAPVVPGLLGQYIYLTNRTSSMLRTLPLVLHTTHPLSKRPLPTDELGSRYRTPRFLLTAHRFTLLLSA